MFTEVKEMINSTIYENGKGEVTAQNVNLAMQGIVEATEEVLTEVKDSVATLEDRVKNVEENGTGGGSQTIVVYYGVLETTEEGEVHSLTPEEKVHNAEAFKAIKESRCLIPVVVDCTRMSYSMMEGVEIYSFYASSPAVFMQYANGSDGGVEMELINIRTFGAGDFNLLPDGTFYME